MEIKVPDLGGAEKVLVVEILVSAGSTVAVDDGLLTLESDKASMDIPSPEAGVIKEILVEVGDDGLARCWWGLSTPDYVAYHDHEWGLPVTDDRRLFEKICLEGFQSGLSWLTILRKRENFRAAFAGFDPAAVSEFGEADVERLKSTGRFGAAPATVHGAGRQSPGQGCQRGRQNNVSALRGSRGQGYRPQLRANKVLSSRHPPQPVFTQPFQTEAVSIATADDITITL